MKPSYHSRKTATHDSVDRLPSLRPYSVLPDSSPLIYLSRVGLLHVLAVLFGDVVVVPRTVWNEVVERRQSAPGIDALRQAPWVRVVEDPMPESDLGLDPGETAAILIAESLRADLLLIDERAGRNVAHERGLAVRGTLCALVTEGFRIAPALIREALAHVGEGPEPANARSTDRDFTSSELSG